MAINTVYYGFGGTPSGTLPAGLVNQAQGTSGVLGNWAVAPDGTLKITNGSTSGLCLYNGQGATGSEAIQLLQTCNGSPGAIAGIILASSGTGSSEAEYTIGVDPVNGGIGLYRFGSGAYAGNDGSQSNTPTFAAGVDYWTKAEISGSTLRVKLWAAAAAEPAAWSATFTDSAITAMGFAGLVGGYTGSAGSSLPAAKALYFGPAGATFAGGVIPPSLSAGTPAATSVPFTWTAAAQSPGNVAYQLQRSARGANAWANVAGAASSPATDATAAAATAYDYRVSATDGINAPAYSAIVAVNTPAAGGSGGSGSTQATGYALSASAASTTVGTPVTITAAIPAGSTLSAPLVITLADTLAATIAGTITIPVGSTSGSTAVNPSAAGTHQLSAAHTGGGFAGGDGSTSFAATQPAPAPSQTTTIAAADANIRLTGRWAGTTTITNGAFAEALVTSDPRQLLFDDSHVIATGLGARPVVPYWIDGFGPIRGVMQPGGAVNLSVPFPSGAHRIAFTADVDSCYLESGPNNYTNGDQALRFLGIVVGQGGSTLPLPPAREAIEFDGDSITGGLRLIYSGSDGVAYDAVEFSWAWGAAQDLGLAPLINGHGGKGITTYSTDGTPPAAASFPYSMAGAAYSPAILPRAVWCYLGTNDTAGFTAAQYLLYLQVVRSERPDAILFAVAPYRCGDGRRSAIQAAVATMADPDVVYLDYSARFAAADTVDGTHFNIGGAQKMRAYVVADVRAAFAARGIAYGPAGAGPAASAAQVAAAMFDTVGLVESNRTFRQSMRKILASTTGTVDSTTDPGFNVFRLEDGTPALIVPAAGRSTVAFGSNL